MFMQFLSIYFINPLAPSKFIWHTSSILKENKMKKFLSSIFLVTFIIVGFTGQSWAFGSRHHHGIGQNGDESGIGSAMTRVQALARAAMAATAKVQALVRVAMAATVRVQALVQAAMAVTIFPRLRLRNQ